MCLGAALIDLDRPLPPCPPRRVGLFSASMLAETHFCDETPTLGYISSQAQRISALITGIAIVHTTGMPVVYSF